MRAIDIITQGLKLKASDIHLTVGRPPVYRINGVPLPIDTPNLKNNLETIKEEEIKTLQPEDTEALAREIMTPDQFARFTEGGELDFSYGIPGVSRVRLNVFKQRGSVALAIRLLSKRIPSFQELGLPEVISYLIRKPNGLVLVTGPTGSGKTTTLAAMIDLISREKRLHIITLEDPIEYLYMHNLSIINQREIGQDTRSFAHALRSALREDPDIILVGEMRDLETISTAITAAETGHLVLATLHTPSAAETINRIIDVFPPDQQQQIRIQLANTIEGIIAQQLIPRIDQPGRIVALEIMIATPAIRNLIRERKTFQIPSQLQTGARYGMQTLDMSLRALYQKRAISKDEVLNRASDPESILELFKK
jgi:twitching motility protein PilT